MSHCLCYIVCMDSKKNPRKNTNDTASALLFTVRAQSQASIDYSWNFVQCSTGRIQFAGKTIIAGGKKNVVSVAQSYRKHPLQNKPKFTLETNPFFSALWYTYLPAKLLADTCVEVRGSTKRLDDTLFAWFTHIAPLLLAIENQDSLLAAELFHKKAAVFMKFPAITLQLLEAVAVEGLFSWVWGSFDTNALADLEKILHGKCVKNPAEWGVAEAFFTAGRRRLDIPSNSSETADEFMARYLRTHRGTKITLGIVGSKHYRWTEKSVNRLDRVSGSKNTWQKLFSKAQSTLQAEPDNPHDPNAVAVYLEHPSEHLVGLSGKIHSGYLRKTSASILRIAQPHKLTYKACLARLGNTQTGPTGIVVEVIV